jgi:branched-chain amino acid transport system permease protein
MSDTLPRFAAIATAALALIALPQVANATVLTTAIAALYLAYQALAWNLIGGLAGQFSLGNTIFIGAGAYTSSYLFVRYGVSPWLGMWLGALIAVVLSMLIGWATFRLNLRGLYFAMVTLALAEMTQVLVENSSPLGAAYGLLIPVRGTDVAAMQFESRAVYYYLALAMVAAAAFTMVRFQRSRIGLMLDGLRENEIAARAVGVPVVRNMQVMFAASAFLSSLGGTFIAQYTLFIDPKSMFAWTEAVVFLLPAIIGGTRHWSGPIVGALLLTLVADATRLMFGTKVGGLALFLYGLVVIAVVMRVRVGIVDWWIQRRATSRDSGSGTARPAQSNAAP